MHALPRNVIIIRVITRPLVVASFALVFLSITVTVQPLGAAEQTLWEIGKFDQSSAEFHRKVDFPNPNDNPIFTVGTGDPSKDWPRRQPGSANSDAGARPHPYTIIFNLTTPHAGPIVWRFRWS